MRHPRSGGFCWKSLGPCPPCSRKESLSTLWPAASLALLSPLHSLRPDAVRHLGLQTGADCGRHRVRGRDQRANCARAALAHLRSRDQLLWPHLRQGQEDQLVGRGQGTRLSRQISNPAAPPASVSVATAPRSDRRGKREFDRSPIYPPAHAHIGSTVLHFFIRRILGTSNS